MSAFGSGAPRDPWRDQTSASARAADARKERFGIRVKREALWCAIRPRLPEDREAVLDAGGGTGYWALRIAREGHRVVLCDVSSASLELAREKIAAAALADRIEVVEADVTDLAGFAPQRFGLVLAAGDPLSYCDDAERALRELHRVTAAGGALVGEVECRYGAVGDPRRAPSWEDARRILDEGIAHWPDSARPARIRAFEPDELERAIRRAGWSRVELGPCDVLRALVGEELLARAEAAPGGFEAAVALECELRARPALLGCGRELQLIARR